MVVADMSALEHECCCFSSFTVMASPLRGQPRPTLYRWSILALRFGYSTWNKQAACQIWKSLFIKNLWINDAGRGLAT